MNEIQKIDVTENNITSPKWLGRDKIGIKQLQHGECLNRPIEDHHRHTIAIEVAGVSDKF